MAERDGGHGGGHGAASPTVLIAAGGTGGHLFPAAALAAVLESRGVAVELATDERVARYGGFGQRATHIIPSATFAARDAVSIARTALTLGRGTLAAFALLGRLRPAAVIGFGGYPTIPPVVAATLRGIPTVIHEQNAVPGRANRLLAPLVRSVATGFAGLFEHDRRLVAKTAHGKTTHTGNPVRPAVIEAAATPYPDPADPAGAFRVLVFGGSQGARVMADIMPAAIELMPVAVRARLMLTQQAREEDVERVRNAYARLAVKAEIEPFFGDLPQRMAHSHIVVSRSGASTVAELAAIGRPAILVPLPHALDQDQRANAVMLENAGGAIMIEQAEFTPERLAAELAELAAAPEKLSAMAAAARGEGRLDAAERLADLVAKVAGIGPR